MIADLRDGIDRVGGIVRELRTFARVDEEAPGPIDVVEAVTLAERMTAHRLRHHVRVRLTCDEVPPVIGHARRLEQVFVNLLLNAAQAMPEGKDENRIDVRVYLAADGRVAIDVEDNGPGMTPDVLKRVFEPFFTTKPVGEATGLGLAISRGIVMRVGGELDIESEPGKGTRAHVRLLCAHPSSAASGVPDNVARGTRPRGRVLLIDDDPRFTFSLRTLLEDDHDVTTMNAGEATQALLLGGQHFDVILCDVMMPGVTGVDLYMAVAASRPELAPRIVFMTGGPYTARAEAFVKTVPNNVLQKPFGVAEVRNVIEDVRSRMDALRDGRRGG